MLQISICVNLLPWKLEAGKKKHVHKGLKCSMVVGILHQTNLVENFLFYE